MLYKFKSKAAGDLILLEPQGRQFLQLIGKAIEPKGIIEAEHMAQAILALQEAVQTEEAQQAKAVAQAQAEGHAPPKFEAISLRQRCKPIIDMLQRCEKAGQAIVWGV
jgi:cyclopropane-fatty-acyl-phospholipid synthase